MLTEMIFFGKLAIAAFPPAIALTIVIMTVALVIRNHGGEIVRYVGRLMKWLVMTMFNEPEAAHHMTKTWRDQQK